MSPYVTLSEHPSKTVPSRVGSVLALPQEQLVRLALQALATVWARAAEDKALTNAASSVSKKTQETLNS